jgi:Protein of unknown function (DUF3024).
MSVQDPVLMFLASRLSKRSSRILPLSIVKQKQSYVVGHKRKRFKTGEDFIEEACKLTFVKVSGMWKLYWKRADLKWHLYETYHSLEAAADEINKDPQGCFFG